MNKSAVKTRKPRAVKKTENVPACVDKQPIEISPEIISKIVLNGDISALSPIDKVKYYNYLCQSLGLNPLTQPFQIIKFQAKETLYATRAATDQLRKIHGISVIKKERVIDAEFCSYDVTVQDRTGRYDVGTAVIPLKGLTPEGRCNAIMKCETKSKRRATLSICGLGILDESELDMVAGFTYSLPAEENNQQHPEEEKKEPVDLDKFIIKACDWIGASQNAKELSSRFVTTENDERWQQINDKGKQEIRDMYKLRENELLKLMGEKK